MSMGEGSKQFFEAWSGGMAATWAGTWDKAIVASVGREAERTEIAPPSAYAGWTDDEYWRARLHWLRLCACIARGA